MTKDGEAYAMPFEPYNVQKEMMRTVYFSLNSSPRHIPIAAIEVPTGCGKTLALLSSVLRYQAVLEKLPPLELAQHLRSRSCKGPPLPFPTSSAGTTSPNWCQCEASTVRQKEERGPRTALETVDDDAAWRVPSLFLKQFRPPTGKRLRVELAVEGSPELRRQHRPPPCTIFYVTRTHAQLRQCVGELRKLKGLCRLKMNILGSRKQYCINPHVLQACANRTLPVEGNNLGEVCDKLVSLGQCEAVHGYADLGNKAITRSLSLGKSDKVWDIEDLVAEGVGTQCCPYYAARDLVFFAHLNFATYQYLLDPLIRHECKMEAALRNHSIIVFDEAHNVPQVCQDALSVESSVATLRLILSEIEPLIQPAVTMATLSYPREFKLTKWTLVELFSLLHDVFGAVTRFVETSQSAASMQQGTHPYSTRGRNTEESDGGCDVEPTAVFSGEVLADVLQHCITDYVPTAFNGGHGKRDTQAAGGLAGNDGIAMFRQVYGIVMSLGVTFNPFQFSISCLSLMKRWILVMRFMIQKPRAFALCISDPPALESQHVDGDDTKGEGCSGAEGVESSRQARRIIGVRCLDGSLAFQHILSTAHRVVLASGTLAPFDQLGRDLGVPLSSMATYEGLHVAQRCQYQLGILTRVMGTEPLHCTYGSLRDPSFIGRLVGVIATLVDGVEVGGVLIFLPNYGVMKTVGLRLISYYRSEMQRSEGRRCALRSPQVFLESQSADGFRSVLENFREATSRGPAVFASVFRAKVSEGIDFADSMARLVVCVGIPLQPLKSWTVQAQRRYSGEEWYINDAMRALNQALGRCIRHSRDYGAMILLDDRFEHNSLRQRLAKWCRGQLKVHRSETSLVNDLHEFFRRHKGQGATTVAQPGQSAETGRGSGLCAGLQRQTTELKENVPNSAKKGWKPSVLEAPFVMGPVGRPKVTTCTHRLSCTALKLIYETHDDVSEVTAEELREALRLLENGFLGLREGR